MKAALLLLQILLALICTAQKKHPALSEVNKALLEQENCAFEPSADAMVLFEHSDINVIIAHQSSKVTIDKKVRIKIFNERGFKHASIRIPYYSRKKSGKIRNLKAVIYTLREGKIHTEKVDSEDFFNIPARENLGVVTFTFPNLRAGSVIEYSYTLVLNNVLQIEPWFIQREIPVAYSSVWITAPHSSEVAAYPLGTDQVTQQEEMKTDFIRRKILFIKNVPSFRPEPFMSSPNDHIARVVFQFFPFGSFMFGNLDDDSDPEPAWKFMGNLIRPIFREMSKIELEGTKPVVERARAMESTEQRIRFIFDTTRLHMFINSGQSLMMDEFTGLWNKREGTSSEINLVLLNLLARSGVSTDALLISTRDNGHINLRYPGFGQFNGVDVVAYDSSKLYILDASARFSQYDNPPMNILNRKALLLNKDITWIQVNDDRFLIRQNFNLLGEITADGILKALVTKTYHDYSKEMRIDSSSHDANENPESTPVGVKVLSYSGRNFEPDGQPLKETVELTMEPLVTGNFNFYNPQSLSSFQKNLFLGDTRRSDIDFGSRQQFTTNISLVIDKDWEIESLPQNVVIRAPDSSIIFTQSVVRQSNGIHYTHLLQIRRDVFFKEEYPGLQEFFRLIFSRVSEDLVLKKKKAP